MRFGFLYWRNSRTPLFRRRNRMPNPPIQLALVWGCRHRSLPWAGNIRQIKSRAILYENCFHLSPMWRRRDQHMERNSLQLVAATGSQHTCPYVSGLGGTCSGDGVTTGGRQVRRSINKMSRLHGKYMCTAAEPKCRGDGLTTYSRCSRCDQDVCFTS